jgi:hypothetical protein
VTKIDNDVVQELINARANGMRRMHPNDISHEVIVAVRMISPGAEQALSGIDAENDGVTYTMWEQAITAAEMTSDLVFPGWDGEGQPVPDVCLYQIATGLIAGRVARAILVLNGYVRGFDTIKQHGQPQYTINIDRIPANNHALVAMKNLRTGEVREVQYESVRAAMAVLGDTIDEDNCR